MNKREINNYYKDIYINLPCSHRIKKVFMKSFKSRVNEFIEDNPNVTISYHEYRIEYLCLYLLFES